MNKIFLLLLIFVSCEMEVEYPLINLSENALVIQAIILSDEVPLVRINSNTYPLDNKIDSVCIKNGNKVFPFFLDTIITVINSGEDDYMKADFDWQVFLKANLNSFDKYYQILYRNDSIKFIEDEYYELHIFLKDSSKLVAKTQMPLSAKLRNLQKFDSYNFTYEAELIKGKSIIVPKLFASFGINFRSLRGHYKGLDVDILDNKLQEYQLDRDSVLSFYIKIMDSINDYKGSGKADSLFFYLESYTEQFYQFQKILSSRNRDFSIFELLYDNKLYEYNNINSFTEAYGIFTLINRSYIKKIN